MGIPNPMSCRLFTVPEAPGRCPASTAVSTYFGTIAGIVTGFFGAGGVSVPEPGAVVMFGVGVVLLRLFTGYAGASIEAHAMPATRQWERLVRSDCGNTDALVLVSSRGPRSRRNAFPAPQRDIGSDVSSQGVDKAYNRAIFRWPEIQ